MSTMRPLVSVVIPVYNMEAYLVETLDSILASDYPALEIVIMDDGSRDNSLALARQYAEKYPSIKECRGMYSPEPSDSQGKGRIYFAGGCRQSHYADIHLFCRANHSVCS